MEMNDHDAILQLRVRLEKLEEEVKRLDAAIMSKSEGTLDKNAEGQGGDGNDGTN